MEDLGD